MDAIREYLEGDSLTYRALDLLLEATGAVGAGFCDACLAGTYPVEIPVNLSKGVLEAGDGPPPERSMPVHSTDEDNELPTQAAGRLFGRD